MARAVLTTYGTIRFGNGHEAKLNYDVSGFSSTEDEVQTETDTGDGWMILSAVSNHAPQQPDKSWTIRAKSGVAVSYDSRRGTLHFPGGAIFFKQQVSRVVQSKRYDDVFIVVLRDNEQPNNIYGVNAAGRQLWQIGNAPAPWKAKRPYSEVYNDADDNGLFVAENGGFSINFDPVTGRILGASVSR
jgi:hypothetical protein